MEIITGLRKLQVNTRDLLDWEEARDLALAGADEAQAQIVREVFTARRAALNGDGPVYEFEVGPPEFLHQWQAVEWARKEGLWDGRPENLSLFLVSQLDLLFRLKSWRGFQAQGQPLPCTLDNKILVFGQAPQIIRVLERKLAAAEDAERKNSEPSRPG